MKKRRFAFMCVTSFVAALALHWFTLYYDMMLNMIYGSQEIPELAASTCSSYRHHPKLDRFWENIQIAGGKLPPGAGVTVALELLDIDALISNVSTTLVSRDGQAAMSVARKAANGIPRLVHQTFKHRLNRIDYPHMYQYPARWEELVKAAGGEYKFWDDESVAQFIGIHFAPAVMSVFRSLVSMSFKADLFRYCVLYILGGVYADMDVYFKPDTFDQLISPGTTFIVPVQRQLHGKAAPCGAWQGLMGAAPGNPFFLVAIMLVVAQVDARLHADTMALTFCPGTVPIAFSQQANLFLT